MKFRIYYEHNGFNDNFIVEGETIEECQELTKIELNRRGWDSNKCWFMESHNLNDMFIILSISKLIDSIHNRIFRRELENAIIDKIIKLEEKEICID